MGPLPINVNRERYITVIIDRFSGFVQMYPLQHISATSTAWCLMKWCHLFGAPNFVLSDNGSDFTSDVWMEIGGSMLGGNTNR